MTAREPVPPDTAARWVVESSSIARDPHEPNGDRLVVGPHVVGIVDGSTAKPWEDSEVTGIHVAEAVAEALARTGVGSTLRETTDRASAAVRQLPGLCDLEPARRPCATFSLVHISRREIWRVGDQTAMIEHHTYPPRWRPDTPAAARRAEVLRQRLDEGASVISLRDDDIGRAAALPLLASANTQRNVAEPASFAAVDGTLVPGIYLEHIPVPHDARHVVLASDGYPVVASSLAATEAALHERIRRDPLLIEEPPATKGVARGAASFDDRTYVRLRLPATHAGRRST